MYEEDRAQLTPQCADEIRAYMEEAKDIFTIQALNQDELLALGFCTEIEGKFDEAYNDKLKIFATPKSKELTLLYFPLHGAGLEPTRYGIN